MKELVLFVRLCLMTDPTNCKTHEEVVFTDLIPMVCAAKAQIKGVELVEEQYPGYRVVGYGCRRKVSVAKVL